ncbi:MAG: TetR/AcrR family transcriptional regulator [Nitriliruptoraceae bacterium]
MTTANETDASPASQPASPPARPRGTGRERLLDAAEELFATHGFTATTTRQIADLAGTSTGAVFYHFPTKEALLEQLIAERSPHANLDAILARHPDDARAGLCHLATAIDETIAERGEVLRIMLHAEDPGTRQLFHRFFGDGVRAIADHLRRTLDPARLGPGHAEALARSFLSVVLLSRLVADLPDGRERLDEVVDVLLHGYL